MSNCRSSFPKAGGHRTLYARAAPAATTQYVHIWGIDPNGRVVGNSDVGDSYDKRVGNADLAPLAEFTVPDPTPGTWRIQVRAVFAVDIPVHAAVALVKALALQLPQQNVTARRSLPDADAHLQHRVRQPTLVEGRGRCLPGCDAD